MWLWMLSQEFPRSGKKNGVGKKQSKLWMNGTQKGCLAESCRCHSKPKVNASPCLLLCMSLENLFLYATLSYFNKITGHKTKVFLFPRGTKSIDTHVSSLKDTGEGKNLNSRGLLDIDVQVTILSVPWVKVCLNKKMRTHSWEGKVMWPCAWVCVCV